MTEPPAVASLLDLTGRIAIVTGASGNIGSGIARRLPGGRLVVVHAGGRSEEAEALVAELGDRAAAVAGDVERDAAAICRTAVTVFGRLDIVANNAGIQPVVPLMSIGPEDAAEMLRVNVGGVIAMTREAAAVMSEHGNSGAIVNVSSIEGLQPAFDHSHYAASKAAVIMHAGRGTRARATRRSGELRLPRPDPRRRARGGLARGGRALARRGAAAPARSARRRRRRSALPRLRRCALDHRRQPRRRRRRATHNTW